MRYLLLILLMSAVSHQGLHVHVHGCSALLGAGAANLLRLQSSPIANAMRSSFKLRSLQSALPRESAPPREHVRLHRRLAIDIGTSSVKVTIADVSSARGRAERMVFQNTYRIPIREEIESSGTKELSKKIKTEIRDVVVESVQLARSLGATEVAAVATLTLENAKNAKTLIDEVKRASGVQITFITPDEEAAIGFEGAASIADRSRYDLIVWDVGGESSEITTLSRGGRYLRYQTPVASATFANLVLSEVKRENPQVVSTPNPLTKEQIEAAVKLAAEKADGVPQPIRQKIGAFNNAVVGIGAIPFLSLDSLGPSHSREEIAQSLYAKADLKDDQLATLFPNHVVTNLALVLGTMEALGMTELTLEVVDLTNGLLFLPQYLHPLPGPKSLPLKGPSRAK